MITETCGPAGTAASAQLWRRRLRAGDEDAFAALYTHHVQHVFALAFRLTGDQHAAEEVVSETFLVAWRQRASVAEDDRPLAPWLLGIAARQSLNLRRGVRRRLAFLTRRTTPVVTEDFADGLADRVDDERRLRRTREALAHLNRREAEVIGLCVWSGLTYAEAAEALDVPVGTVRSRLSRARARLRDLVEETEHEARGERA